MELKYIIAHKVKKHCIDIQSTKEFQYFFKRYYKLHFENKRKYKCECSLYLSWGFLLYYDLGCEFVDFCKKNLKEVPHLADF